jgi:hypothetical protein
LEKAYTEPRRRTKPAATTSRLGAQPGVKDPRGKDPCALRSILV